MNYNTIVEYIIIACVALIAITLHELAHGYTAYKLGDNTAKERGRLTLNPIKHIDPIGLLALIVVHIGWAKPVPINPMNFKSRKNGTILVSIAGPLTNLLLAVVFAILLRLTYGFNLYLSFFFQYGIILNIGLAVFNLLPLPPLDGSKILASLLPIKLERLFYKYQRYLSIIVLVLYITGIIRIVIIPVIQAIYNGIIGLVF